MGISQDLLCPVLISFQLVGDVFLFVSSKLQCCSRSLSYGRWPGSLLVVLLCTQYGGILFGPCLLSVLVFSSALKCADVLEYNPLADVIMLNKWTFECSKWRNQQHLIGSCVL